MRRTSWPAALLSAGMSAMGAGACSSAPTVFGVQPDSDGTATPRVYVDSVYPGYNAPDSALELPATALPDDVFVSQEYGRPQYVRVTVTSP